MANAPDFDVAAAHKYFAADCFNKAWALMDQASRTPDEDEDMIRLNRASHWHWTQRDDCTNTNLSVGYWQASRIHALLGEAGNARKYGRLCLDVSAGEEPFYHAYAYEALARAESVAGDRSKMNDYLMKARELAEQVVDPDWKGHLVADIDTIQ